MKPSISGATTSLPKRLSENVAAPSLCLMRAKSITAPSDAHCTEVKLQQQSGAKPGAVDSLILNKFNLIYNTTVRWRRD